MGINISGNTDIISATDGSLTIQGADFTAIAAGSTAAPSISPTGDSNTGIFFPSADTIAFGEGGSEALRINSSGGVQIANGNLVFSTAGTGIDFSATANSSGTMSSELLSDYEEGSWTPAYTASSVSFGYGNQTGSYVKIGQLVYAQFYLRATSVTGTTSNDVQVTNLPFTSLSDNALYQPAGSVWYSGNAGVVVPLVAHNSTTMNLYIVSSLNNVTAAQVNGNYFVGSVVYRSAS